MGLVHTPRVIVSLAKGLYKRRNNPNASLVGVGPTNPHRYIARAGLFDVDYLGHLNNAAYLNHAELARWEMTAYNGLLNVMMRNNIAFLVAGTSIRYRREIRPLFREFSIDTSVAGIDADKNIWVIHDFRYPIEGNNRIRAQMVVRAVVKQGRGEVLDPVVFLKDIAGIDGDVVDAITMPIANVNKLEELLECHRALEDRFRDVAAADDARNTDR